MPDTGIGNSPDNDSLIADRKQEDQMGDTNTNNGIPYRASGSICDNVALLRLAVSQLLTNKHLNPGVSIDPIEFRGKSSPI